MDSSGGQVGVSVYINCDVLRSDGRRATQPAGLDILQSLGLSHSPGYLMGVIERMLHWARQNSPEGTWAGESMGALSGWVVPSAARSVLEIIVLYSSFRPLEIRPNVAAVSKTPFKILWFFRGPFAICPRP